MLSSRRNARLFFFFVLFLLLLFVLLSRFREKKNRWFLSLFFRRYNTRLDFILDE
jgi:hypothetical protein